MGFLASLPRPLINLEIILALVASRSAFQMPIGEHSIGKKIHFRLLREKKVTFPDMPFSHVQKTKSLLGSFGSEPASMK